MIAQNPSHLPSGNSLTPTGSSIVLACPRCGVIDTPTVGSGNGPHAFRATCRHCGRFLQWLSKFPQSEREARRQLARRQAMAGRPPSQAQLDYLKVLGDQAEPPGSAWDASQRIDALLSKGVTP